MANNERLCFLEGKQWTCRTYTETVFLYDGGMLQGAS